MDIKQRHKQLAEELADATSNQDIARLGKESARLTHIVELIDERNATLTCISELAALEKDEKGKGPDGEEMAMLARSEIDENAEKLVELEARIVRALTPRDEADDRGVVLEVRAGTGGDEASLFAGELFKMYQKYASLMGWHWEEMSLSKSEIGGFKGAQASITGEAVYKMMKFESGVHRVQRVPVNDVRIQTR
jgi:peptide chain release factor 1